MAATERGRRRRWFSVGFLAEEKKGWRRLDGKERRTRVGEGLVVLLKRGAWWPVDGEKRKTWSSRECTWPDMVMPLTCKKRERRYVWLFLV
jgi:monoamine oxidase